MAQTRCNHTALLLPNGKVLVAGGDTSPPALSSCELYLSSLSLFRIASHPQSQVGYWGKSVSFSVTVADGIPPYSYQWLKDNVAIPGATGSLLVPANLQATDAGVYKVVVSDTSNSLTSQPASLTVNAAGVDIALYAGVTIDGVVGQTYALL